MDITVIDFFRSKYVMAHPDIVGMLEVALVDEVKNLRQILAIDDGEERKHQEALILWRRIPLATRNDITRQFNVWIGNVPVVEHESDSDSDSDAESDSDVEELKEGVNNMNIDDEVKTRVKKHSAVKKKVDKKKTRKLTTPIYASRENGKLMDFVSKNEIKNNNSYAIYRLAFERAVHKGVVNTIWDSIRTHDYGDKSEKPFPVIRPVFSNVSYYNRSKFKDIFPTVMFAIHNVLMGAGIYDDYPTFSDYKNLAAHIILKGKDYCNAIINDPQLVRPLLEYEEYHPIWNHYKKTL